MSRRPCKTSCRDEAIKVLHDVMSSGQEEEDIARRQLSTGGNELAQIFNEIAQSQVEYKNLS